MLSDTLKTLLATNYHFVIKTQFFHWNVEGPDFVQLHDLFGKIYEDAYGAVDVIAEQIRTLDSNPPGSFTRFASLSVLQDQTQIPRARLMIEELLHDNMVMVDLLNETFKDADREDAQDIADFISQRIGAHNKWSWMLKSLLREERA